MSPVSAAAAKIPAPESPHLRLEQKTRIAPEPPRVTSPWPDRALAILRVVAGIIFVTAGTMKLFGYPASPVPMPPFRLLSEFGIAGVLETLGGLAIALGWFTRPVAFVLCGEMAVAYFQFHFPLSVFPTVNNGVPAVLYCFLYLYLAVGGGGAWSVDRFRGRAR